MPRTLGAIRSCAVLAPVLALLTCLLATPTVASGTGTQTHYRRDIFVIRYFPLAADGTHIDIDVTGDVGEELDVIRARTDRITSQTEHYLSEGTRYHGYGRPGAEPSLTFRMVARKTHLAAVPTLPGFEGSSYAVRADYRRIMDDHDICAKVDGRLGVDEVWIWAYNGKLDISESKMSGPYGDISNSYRLDDMPHCGRTYVVYTFNYGRDTAEAVHSYGHQIEAELQHFSPDLMDRFWGPAHPGADAQVGRCGSVHNPPNSRSEYDYANPTTNATDCRSWDPDGIGVTRRIGCATWGCDDLGSTDNAQLDWLVWWMQSIPGRGNHVDYRGRQLRNWWDALGAFDRLNARGEESSTAPVANSRRAFVSSQFLAASPRQGHRLRATRRSRRRRSSRTIGGSRANWGLRKESAPSTGVAPAIVPTLSASQPPSRRPGRRRVRRRRMCKAFSR